MSIRTLGKKLALSFQAALLVLGLGLSLSPAAAGVAMAQRTPVPTSAGNAACTSGDLSLQNGAACANPGTSSKGLFDQGGIFQTVANVLVFLVGAIAVLFLIIGGLRYVISNGDPKAVEAAKNTILYAIIGIVVAILSFAAVQFVINTFSK